MPSGQFDEMESKVGKLIASVADDLQVATQAVIDDFIDPLNPVNNGAAIVDGLCKELADLVSETLTTSQVPRDVLVRLLTVLQLVPELGRSHDLVVQIAEGATLIRGRELSRRSLNLLSQMGAVTMEMWDRTAEAWSKGDSIAEVLDRLDDELDQHHDALTAELASAGTAVPLVVKVGSMAGYYERLGLHAIDIARQGGGGGGGGGGAGVREPRRPLSPSDQARAVTEAPFLPGG